MCTRIENGDDVIRTIGELRQFVLGVTIYYADGPSPGDEFCLCGVDIKRALKDAGIKWVRTPYQDYRIRQS